ncbi:MAG TPA: aldo/keto reductase, partial [Ignavibacteriales bacterium]|nr:aldo/keto reductase [Ignavibacteriales bacterium]
LIFLTTMNINSIVKLNNGISMPVFGLGTYQSKVGAETRNAVSFALKYGYRLIDTAAVYGNEADVGAVVKESGLPREELFITTKVWNSDQGYYRTLDAFDESLRRLDMDYVDLYLIHWPVPNLRRESWKALEEIYASGRARSVGVSNYTIRHIEELLDYSSIIPVVNQVEFSPYLYQEKLMHYCNDNGIAIEAYSPLTRGKKLRDPRLITIALKYSKSPAQLLIRWALQTGTIVIPKSVHAERIRENAEVFDFEIRPEDMAELNTFNENFRPGWDPSDVL